MAVVAATGAVMTVAVASSRRLLAVVYASFGRRTATGSPGLDQAVVPLDRAGGMLAMEADGWAEWAGAAPESPLEAPPTPIGPFELELGELPELVVTWAARRSRDGPGQ